MNGAQPPQVVVVVVTFDAPERLERCLASIDHAGGVEHTVVVDNGPTRTIGSSATRTVIRPDVNGGFGAGANDGFAAARRRGADVIVLLNDDVVVSPRWLAPIVEALFEAPDIGAVQPMLVLAGTSPPQVNSLGVVIGADGAGCDIGLGSPVADADRGAHDIAVFSGGAVAFRPSFLLDTNGFDERYFLYYEDVDLARRGAHSGWRYRCVPESIVEHEKGASTTTLGNRTVYLRERNRLWSAFRNESGRTIVASVWLSIRRLRHSPRSLHAVALASGVCGGIVRLWERLRDRRR